VNLPAGTHVHIITDQSLFRFDIDTVVRFWGRQDDLSVDLQPRSTLTNNYFIEQPLGIAHAFFVEPGDEQVLSMIREFFIPEAPRVSPYGVPPEYQMILYYVQPGSRVPR
jgi:hypothetical protein